MQKALGNDSAEAGLRLNRALFDKDGDAVARELALYISTHRLLIGEVALQELIAAARQARRG